jgi:hypothetical protein
MRLRDSPNSCRWAATSMGSVSGALAGDAGNSMVVGGDFFGGDCTPTEEAENRGVKICLQPQISENNIPDFTCL